MSLRQVKAALKGKEVGVIARASTTTQKKALKNQIEKVLNRLADLKVKQPVRVFSEQVSGTAQLDKRPQMRLALEWAEEKPGKRVLVMRDWNRWARDNALGQVYKKRMMDVGVRLVNLDGNEVTDLWEDIGGSGRLSFNINMLAGEIEALSKKAGGIEGQAIAKEKGVLVGTPLDVHAPWRMLWQSPGIPLDSPGLFKQTNLARHTQKSSSWVRKGRTRLQLIQSKQGIEGVEDWLDFIEQIASLEERVGPGWGPNKVQSMQAVRRMTGGTIDTPWKFPYPSDEALSEWMNNPKEFLRL